MNFFKVINATHKSWAVDVINDVIIQTDMADCIIEAGGLLEIVDGDCDRLYIGLKSDQPPKEITDLTLRMWDVAETNGILTIDWTLYGMVIDDASAWYHGQEIGSGTTCVSVEKRRK